MRRLTTLLLLGSLALPLAAFERQPLADYRARRLKLAEKLEDRVLLFFADTEGEPFRQGNDFFYLTGWNQPGAAVVIAAARGDRPYTEVLLLPQRNLTQERWTGPKLDAATPDAAKLTGFDRVESLDRIRDVLANVVRLPRTTILTDLSDRRTTPSTVPLEWLRRVNAFPSQVFFADAKPLIAELRLIKDAGEIALLRKATNATVAAHKAAAKALRPGVTENEIAGLIEYEFRRGGCQGRAFPSIVAAGLNSTVLHYSDNSETVADGDVVVIDIGAECSGYASDVTRTYAANGRFTPRQKEIYDIVLGAQRAAENAFKAGVSTIARTGENSLHKVAYDYIEARKLGKYFIHGLSHYVGLAVHDAGSASTPLAPGTVFTIEPGIYIPEEKIGVRIEDTYLVLPSGALECLSCGAAK